MFIPKQARLRWKLMKPFSYFQDCLYDAGLCEAAADWSLRGCIGTGFYIVVLMPQKFFKCASPIGRTEI